MSCTFRTRVISKRGSQQAERLTKRRELVNMSMGFTTDGHTVTPDVIDLCLELLPDLIDGHPPQQCALSHHVRG